VLGFSSFKPIFMHISLKQWVFIAAILLGAGFGTPAYARTPSLSVQVINTGTVQVSVSGDAYASVSLIAPDTNQYSWNIGTTNSSGYLTTQLSLNSCGIPSGSNVYVLVNGMESEREHWPYSNNSNNNYYNNYNTDTNYYPYNSYNSNNYNYQNYISLSQTNVSLRVGQTSTLTAFSNYGSVYISNTSNSNVATAVMSGNQITVIAHNQGSATITVCAPNTSCVSLYVTVEAYQNYYDQYYNYNQYPSNNYNYNNYPYNYPNNYQNYANISVSQSSVSLGVGQSTSISLYGGNNYYLSANSSIVNVTLNGSTMTLYGNTPGSGTLTVCSSSSRSCQNISVSVNGSYHPYNNSYYSNNHEYYNNYNNRPNNNRRGW
jgi:hypothetical protein